MTRLGIGWGVVLAVLLAALGAAGAVPSGAQEGEPTAPGGVGFLTAVAGPGAQPTGDDPAATGVPEQPDEPAGVGFQTAVARVLAGQDGPAATAQPDPNAGDDPLAARLGGTVESFEAAYGPPTGGDERSGAFYDVRGYGLVFAQFRDGRVVSINLGPQRPADKPATQPDPADWTLAKARELTGRFLPGDAQLGEEGAGGGGALLGGGRSAALAGVFDEGVYAELAPGGQPGDLAYRFVTTVAGGVSAITIGLGAGVGAPDAPGQDPADRCAGIREWVLATGERVDRAGVIAAELETLDVTAPDTPTVLHGWSQEFLRLTDEQRRGAVPPIARDVNALVVGAFNAYSLTMDLLSIAVVTGDTGAVDAAFVALDEGSANFERAATLLDPVVQECG